MSTKKERQGRAVEGEGNVFPIAIPPFAAGNPRIWVDDSYWLRLSGWTFESSLTFQLTYLLQRPDGVIDRYSESVSPTITSGGFKVERQLDTGWLVSVEAVSTAAITARGTFAGLELSAGASGSRTVVYTLSRAALTTRMHLSWPVGPLEHPMTAPGALHEFTISDPGGGNNASITVPANQMWRIRVVSFRLPVDATAANRHVHIDFHDESSTEFANAIAAAVQTANSEVEYSFFINASASGPISGREVGALPDVWLRETAQIRINVTNIQGGDTMTDIRGQVERMLVRVL